MPLKYARAYFNFMFKCSQYIWEAGKWLIFKKYVNLFQLKQYKEKSCAV